MELRQLRCFIAVADELHFGRAAQRMDMLPSALGRYIRLLEEDLGTRLLTRSTRSVALTPHGALFLAEARAIITHSDALRARFQKLARQHAGRLRIGAIDSALVGLVPRVLQVFRQQYPDVEVQITEDKSSKLIPQLKAGRLDLLFARTPEHADGALESRFLFYENVILAISDRHPLAQRAEIHVEDLAGVPLIVPERRSRPHSYDLTVKFFENAGFQPNLVHITDEKQTIINMVAAELGAAIMPRWITRTSPQSVAFVPFAARYEALRQTLPVGALWMKQNQDEVRDWMIDVVMKSVGKIAQQY